MHCSTCHLETKGTIDMRLQIAINEAKIEAVKMGEPKAICQGADGEYYHLNAYAAYRHGHRVEQVVSQYP